MGLPMSLTTIWTCVFGVHNFLIIHCSVIVDVLTPLLSSFVYLVPLLLEIVQSDEAMKFLLPGQLLVQDCELLVLPSLCFLLYVETFKAFKVSVQQMEDHKRKKRSNWDPFC